MRQYLDEAGKAVRSKAGYAGYRFDARGNRTEVASFNETGTATVRRRYDDQRSSAGTRATHAGNPSSGQSTNASLSGRTPRTAGNADGVDNAVGNTCEQLMVLAQTCYDNSSLATPCAFGK